MRRLEGNKLHPLLTSNGIRLFDPKEVAEVAREVATTGRALDGDTPFADRPDPDEGDDHQASLLHQLRDLESQLLEERRKNAQLQRETDDLRRAQLRWKAQVDGACATVVTALNGELDAEALDALHDLVDALDS